MSRDDLIGRMRSELTGTTAQEPDVVELLRTLADHSAEVLDVTATGVMLVAPTGRLRIMAWSRGAEPVVELFELQTSEGPGLDCYRTNRAVANHDLQSAGSNRRWPRFAPAARRAGFRGADGIPMRVGHQVIGSLALLRYGSTPLGDDELLTAQGLADLATVAVLQHDAAGRGTRAVEEQLDRALHDRMLIEQAKGMIAERDHVTIDEAFARIRHRARSDQHRVVDVAAGIVDGTLRPSALEVVRRST